MALNLEQYSEVNLNINKESVDNNPASDAIVKVNERLTKLDCDRRRYNNRLNYNKLKNSKKDPNDCNDESPADKKITDYISKEGLTRLSKNTSALYSAIKNKGLENTALTMLGPEINSFSNNAKFRTTLTKLNEILCNDPTGGLEYLSDFLNGLDSDLLALLLSILNCPLDPKLASINMLGMANEYLGEDMNDSDNKAFSSIIGKTSDSKFEIGVATELLGTDIGKRKTKESWKHKNSDKINVSNDTIKRKNKENMVEFSNELLPEYELCKEDTDIFGLIKYSTKETTINKETLDNDEELTKSQIIYLESDIYKPYDETIVYNNNIGDKSTDIKLYEVIVDNTTYNLSESEYEFFISIENNNSLTDEEKIDIEKRFCESTS